MGHRTRQLASSRGCSQVQQIHPRLRNPPSAPCKSCPVLASTRSFSNTFVLQPPLTSRSVDVDITKPDTGFMTVERPHSQRTPSEIRSSGAPTPDATDGDRTYAEPLSEGEGDEDMDLAPARDEGARIGLGSAQAADAIAYREKQLKERAQRAGPSRARSSEILPVLHAPPTTPAPRPPPHQRLRTLSIDPLAPSSTFDERFKARLNAVKRANEEAEADEAQASAGGDGTGDDRILTREWRAPPGKRIAIPVRIEPKVYFATERTFLVRIRRVLFRSLLMLYNRAGCTLPYTSGLSRQRCSTSSLHTIRADFYAPRCSHSPHCSRLFTLPAYSCTARYTYANGAPKVYTTTSLVRPSCLLSYLVSWERTLCFDSRKWRRVDGRLSKLASKKVPVPDSVMDFPTGSKSFVYIEPLVSVVYSRFRTCSIGSKYQSI